MTAHGSIAAPAPGDAVPAPRPAGGEAELPPDAPRTRNRGAAFELAAKGATPVAFLILLVGVYGPWLGGQFFNSQQRVFDIYQNVSPLLISIGVLIAMCAHVFDLSAGFMATLSAFLTIGLTVKQGLPLGLSIVIALVVGCLGGLLNALLVVTLRINAFIATLGTGGVFLGAYTMYAGGSTVSFSDKPATTKSAAWFNGSGGLGSFTHKADSVLVWILVAVLLAAAWNVVSFKASGRRVVVHAACALGAAVIALLLQLSGVPDQVNYSIVVLLVVALVTWAVMRWTRLGRFILATGGNATAASLAGVPTGRITTYCYLFSGLMAGLAGVLLAANQGTAVPGIADNYLLPAYASVFLSTVILSAGRFHVWGAIGGGIAIVYIAQGLVVGGVGFTWTDLVNGIVLILAVALSTLLNRGSRR